MADIKKKSIEEIINNKNIEGSDSNSYNRRNVNTIKRLILLSVIVLCVIPVVFCFFLLIKIQKLENKMNTMIELISSDKGADIDDDKTLVKNVSTESELQEGELLISEKDTINLQTNLTMQAEKNFEEIIDNTVRVVNSSNNEEDNYNDGVQLNGKKVYLTFDDGPSIYTSEILDILNNYNVKATFFVIGRDYEYYDEYKRIVNEGHTLGMHSFTHSYNDIYEDIDSFSEDINNLHELLYRVTGVDSKYYRFPGGSSNLVANVNIEDCIEYLNKMNYSYYDWNSLNGDAVSETLTPDQLINNVMRDVRSNEGDSIVLMHDISTKYETVESLSMLIELLQSEGYEICPINDNTPLIQHVK